MKKPYSATFIFSIFLSGAALFLAGCQTPAIDLRSLAITNLTSPTLPANPSNIYTIQVRVSPRVGAIQRESLRTRIVIDGQSFLMSRSALSPEIWEFDYRLPPGRASARYYYLVNYDFRTTTGINTREDHSEIYDLRIVDRYVLSLDVNRAPVGARVSIVGRGFTPDDVVNLDGTPATTVYESPNAISFFVPSVPSGRNYEISVTGPRGSSRVGSFRVDATSLSVVPASVSVQPGDGQVLVFTIPEPAPPGGLLIPVTTDVPDSVVMPEVVIPSGSRSVSITVQGGEPGSGTLFVEAGDAGEIQIPVTVRP